MSDSDTVRRNHFKQFMSLSAGERLERAISGGYEMYSLLPEKTKVIFQQMRNGSKKGEKKV